MRPDMERTLEDKRLAAITGWISEGSSGKDKHCGTGYLIARDLVATCAHVIPASPTALKFHHDGQEYAAQPWRVDPVRDAAILKLQTAVPVRTAMQLRPDCPSNADWIALGYPTAAAGDDGTPAQLFVTGTVVATSTMSPSGLPSIQLHCEQMASGTAVNGLSGAPVVVDGVIVGHVAEQIPGAQGGAVLATLYAAPANAVQDLHRKDASLTQGLLPLLDLIDDAPSDVVLGVVDLQVHQVEMLRDLREAFRSGAIDLRFHYLGPMCAENWIRLSSSAVYGNIGRAPGFDDVIEDLAHHTGASLESSANAAAVATLVSLGCGDGDVDRLLIEKLRAARIPLQAYVPIDMSADLLQRAVNTLNQTINGVSVLPVLADLERLDRVSHVWPSEPNVEIYSLLGFTLGNFQHEMKLLGAVRSFMRGGDLLVLDARCFDGEDIDLETDAGKTLTRAIISRYRHAENVRFASGPLAFKTSRPVSENDVVYRVTERTTSAIPGALKVSTVLPLSHDWKKDLETDRDELTLAWSSVYPADSLEARLKDSDLTIVARKVLNRQNGVFTAVYILRRT